jgi:hypothetical protein
VPPITYKEEAAGSNPASPTSKTQILQVKCTDKTKVDSSIAALKPRVNADGTARIASITYKLQPPTSGFPLAWE